MLLFEKYRKSYGKTEIISIPRLKLEHGVYWLRGENGSGKTTMIRSIAGLVPFDGTIEVCGTNVRKNRVAYTSIVNHAEAEPIYPEFLTGNDLLTFYAEAKKAPKGQLEALSAKLGVAAYSGNKTSTYSSGMAKKLSLVLGFIGNPKLILLDEPLITLDTNAVAILQDLVQGYHRAGVSFIITSHQEITIKDIKVSHLHVQNKTLTIS